MALAFVTAGFAQSEKTNSQTATQQGTVQTKQPEQKFQVKVDATKTVEFSHDGTYFTVWAGKQAKQLKTGWENGSKLVLKPFKVEQTVKKTDKGTFVTLVYTDQNSKTHIGQYDVDKQVLLPLVL